MRTFRQLLLIQIAFFCYLSAQAQTPVDYKSQWEKIDALIQQKNLPRSALIEVKKIYTNAKQKGAGAQVIKALVYMTRLQESIREDNVLLSIAEIEKEITVAQEPSASLLKSLLAGMYLQYFYQHRGELYNRTPVSNGAQQEIATWGLQQFHRRIYSLFAQSLKAEKRLQGIRLEAYDAIIQKGNVRYLRPTLYDLLAHRALDYFQTGEAGITQPVDPFTISNNEAFAPAVAFSRTVFSSRDSLSQTYAALVLYQKLIRFHLTDAPTDALADVDLKRIQFVYEKATGSEKENLYAAALTRLAKNAESPFAKASAGFLLASYYNNLADTYHPLRDTTNRFQRLKAKSLLQEIVADSTDQTEAWANSYNLLKEIEQPRLSFEIENVNVPGKPFRVLVSYRQLPAVHFKLVKAEQLAETLTRGYPAEQFWVRARTAEALRSWTQSLPATSDHQEHSVEVKVDALPVGNYVLLAYSPDSNKPATQSARPFHVSNISYTNKQDKFFVLHRETGQPLSGAAITMYAKRYNYETEKWSKNKIGSYTANTQGFFKMDNVKQTDHSRFVLEIKHKEDYLFLDEEQQQHLPYYANEQAGKKETRKIFFFTDRSLYRPGQTVYFKGIVVSSTAGDHSIASGHASTIQLRDINDQIIDTLQVITNEYGSFSGRFSLPNNNSTGAYNLGDKGGNDRVRFSVEEYKRPKFYAAFDTIRTSFRLGDTIRIKGVAKAFSGNNIDGAQVIYRVVRQPRFLYPWLFWRGGFPAAPPMEIVHGVTTTGADGNFYISFPATADKSIDPRLEPLFDFRIYADVTDINGETRSSDYLVTAGYKSLLLSLKLPEKASLDALKTITVLSQNMNGAHQQSEVSLKITQLVPGQRLIRKRYWQQPDQFVMDQATFIGYFPHDEYRNESDYRDWAKGQVVYMDQDSTRANGVWLLAAWEPAPGIYEVALSAKDKDGLEVKDIQFIEIYDPNSDRLTTPQYLWTKGGNSIVPGETTRVTIGSSAPDIFLIQQTDKKNRDGANARFIALNSEKQQFTFGATEGDRGGYGVQFFFVKDNRLYNLHEVISVPWTNKEIAINFATFREKTLPGSDEQWTVTIKGAKGEKVAAEMLASMYDASLDAFQPHNWTMPPLYPEYSQPFDGEPGMNFTSVPSFQNDQSSNYKQVDKIYDQLIFDQFGRQFGRVEMLNEMATVGVKKTAALQRGVPSAKAGAALENQVKDIELQLIERDTTTVANQVVSIRRNFNETAFFFPHLTTDKNGDISFSFTTPEALTRWKLQTLAHTKELAFGSAQRELITQKELMVQPAAPRFLRQGDRIEFTAKIVNLSAKEITGQAEFQLVDATTNQSVDGWFLNSFPNQYFTVAAGGSEMVKFPMEVPYQFTGALVWRVIARAGNLSDGEEMSMPVLTNKVLVTETLPLIVRSPGVKNFSFGRLLKSSSPTLVQHALTVEYSSRPAWYAVQALPFLMENVEENVEAIWNRFYANALATHIVSASPRIRQVFATRKTLDTAALLSNLQKNEELKAALLRETPWVLQAKTEEAQKKQIALLFDLVKRQETLQNDLDKLKQWQLGNGAFSWMKGAPDDRYMTQYVLTGMARLRKLDALPNAVESGISGIEKRALQYLEAKIVDDHALLIRKKVDLKKNHLQPIQIQYLYLQSLYNRTPSKTATAALNYYRKQAAQFWASQSNHLQGLIALALHRSNQPAISGAIVKSLKENAIMDAQLGMYWKGDRYYPQLYWHQAPIETQALLIEVFTEIGKDQKTVDACKTWLILNKQTNNWRTSKATADACYALLLQGTDWLSAAPAVEIKLGTTTINSNDQKGEAGTGYFKTTIAGALIKPAMGNITLTPEKGPGQAGQSLPPQPSWGAVYWQYFEDIDKVSRGGKQLSVTKNLFLATNTARGVTLVSLVEGSALKPGNKLMVRLELRVDRDMEYVHLKDLRASSLEPINVLSSYKWQGGLGYYESTRDESTSFFFPLLRRGTYVFEYPLFVTHAGNFSAGIATIQSMYAPEFAGHSAGIRLQVE